MEYTIQKILEFHDLFPEENDLDVRTLLTKYSREYVVRCCHVLCNNYGNAAFIPDTNNTFFSDVSTKHISNLNSRILRYFNATGQNKICYCTIKTVLELMRIAFSIPIQEFRNDGQKEDSEYDLFRSVLMLNEQLMNFSHADQLDLSTLLFSCYYVQNDIINQDTKYTFVRQVIHYKRLSEFLTNHPQCKNALNLFFQKMGIKSMDEYSKTWMSLVVLSMDYQKKKIKACPIFDYYSLKDEDSLISKNVLDNLSIDITETIAYNAEDAESRDDNVDYRTFRSRPLVRIKDGQSLVFRLFIKMFFEIIVIQ